MLLTVKSWGLLELLRRFSITWYLSFCYFSCIIYFILNHIELSVSQQTLINWQNLIGFSIDDVSTLSRFPFLLQFFSNIGVHGVLKPHELFNRVTKLDLKPGDHQEFLAQVSIVFDYFPLKKQLNLFANVWQIFTHSLIWDPTKSSSSNCCSLKCEVFLLFPYLNFYVIDNAIRWGICIFLSILLESSIHDRTFGQCYEDVVFKFFEALCLNHPFMTLWTIHDLMTSWTIHDLMNHSWPHIFFSRRSNLFRSLLMMRSKERM